MGVLNVTPDSFSDGGINLDPERAVTYGLALAASGADVVDVGGESTRPGAAPVDRAEEIGRVIPVIEGLVASGVVVSIDTMKPEVAEAAIAAGADIINDVSGFRDPGMRRVAAISGAGVVVMHMLGEPRTMQDAPHYDDVVSEVASYLGHQARLCEDAGVDPGSIFVDPGIGFGKTVEHNLVLLSRLDEIVSMGRPVMVGASRKSFLGKVLDIPSTTDRDLPTAVVTAMAVERGASAVRVHEPAGSRHAARLARAIVVAGVDGRGRRT